MSGVVAMKEEMGMSRPVFAQVAREHQDMMLVYARTLLRDELIAREVVQAVSYTHLTLPTNREV